MQRTLILIGIAVSLISACSAAPTATRLPAPTQPQAAPTAAPPRLPTQPPPPPPQTQPAPPTQPTPIAAQSARADTTITIGALIADKTIKPLLGVNIGPLPAGADPKNADLTSAYKEIGVTLIRTHDFYGPLDMSALYPDRARDPSDVKSYNLAESDRVWRAIVNGGFEPYFRLGDSWNNAKPPANAAERANWVKAAVEVVRHYREGKWNGFTTKFRYVEIWNEPDHQQFWEKPRTPQEYFQLYDETARALKQTFTDLIVGAPGLTPAGALAPQGNQWTRDFLDYVKQKNAPLDFFSWHMYSNDPNDWANAAKFYRDALDSRGFKNAAMHVTEWNTAVKDGRGGSPDATALRTGGKGAAILTAAWIAMQQNEIEVSTFYRGPDPAMNAPTFYGMFYADGQPKRIALAFSLWAKMAAYPKRVNVSAAPNSALWLLAGHASRDAGEIALLIANTGDAPIKYNIAGASRAMNIYQVNDASEELQSIAPTANVFEIGGNTTQLVITGK